MLIRGVVTMLVGLVLAGPAAADDDPLLAAMEAELARTMAGLASQEEPPYYLAYEVVESRVVEMHAEDGAFGSHSESHTRHYDVDVRVGDPSLDNTHPDTAVEDGPGGHRRADYTLPVTTTRGPCVRPCGRRPSGATGAPSPGWCSCARAR